MIKPPSKHATVMKKMNRNYQYVHDGVEVKDTEINDYENEYYSSEQEINSSDHLEFDEPAHQLPYPPQFQQSAYQ
jgi:hypothetical protein